MTQTLGGLATWRVRVSVGNTVVRIQPGATARRVLQSSLMLPRHQFEPGGKLGHRHLPRVEQLFREEDDTFIVNAGHATLAIAKLRAVGLTVTVQSHVRLDPRAEPHPSNLAAVHPRHRSLLEALAGHQRGTIVVAKPEEVVRVIAQACRLFPEARMLIPLNASKKTLSRFRHNLRAAGVGDVHDCVTWDWPCTGGRLVCDLKTFGWHQEHRQHDFDIVIFPDTTQILPLCHFDALDRLQGHRVFGFVWANQPLTTGARLWLEGLLGPVIYRMPNPRGDLADVSVSTCVAPPGVSPPRSSALDQKRALWHDGRRNDTVAELAKALGARDLAAVAQGGLALDDSQLVTVSAVYVLAESLEHARELVGRLPGWTLADLHTAPESVDAKRRSPFARRSHSQLVLTLASAARLKILDTDALLVASPVTPLNLPGFPPRTLEAGRRVLLVEFDEATGSKVAMRRHRLYDQRGWLVGGVAGATAAPALSE